ncbi:YceI family protein [Paraburkholderia sp. J12]|uniref:YceI family protein n=1 Tax=Paraburkholderia sp. J12 TaxID=2805432 RepID=UPI002ABE3DAB|nr:YceI family protein [Paraburkholderia sp. J12]
MGRISTCATAIVAFLCAACPAVGRSADPVDPSAPQGLYRLDPHRSAVVFDIANVWRPALTMRFSRVRAQLDGFDDRAAGHVMVTIDATSLESSTPFVAGVVEGNNMLDVVHYPVIRFVGTHFVRTGALTGLLTGDLTIRETTHAVALAVTVEEDPRDPPDAPRTRVFSADGHFSRAAFGLSKWPSVVGDDVHMKIRAEFVGERPDP